MLRHPRLLLAALVISMLAIPASASADGILGQLNTIYNGSQNPVPQGRGKYEFFDRQSPCGNNQLTERQKEYWGWTKPVQTWDQIGTQPLLLPPGTFWVRGDEEGYFPAEPGAVESIPPGQTTLPYDARRITSARWVTVPGGGRLVSYQPKTTLACSLIYRLKYDSILRPGQQISVPTAVCGDANTATPFVQWVQDLSKNTPALFSGLAGNSWLVEGLRKALDETATKSAKTVVINTFKELWGGKPSKVLTAGGFVNTLLNALVGSYIYTVAKQTEPISNADWDYYVDKGIDWAYWMPPGSEMTAGRLSIEIMSLNPAADLAGISVACTSTPTVQGSVIDLRSADDEVQLQPSYYGSPLDGTGVSARASASSATTPDEEVTADDADTVNGADKKQEDVSTGEGNDEVVGSPGDDTIHGGPGDDKLIGGPGADELVGGPGEDLLVDLSAEPDVISGGEGTDRIDVRDGSDAVDQVNCGPGEDIVLADPSDQVAPDCEHVYRSLEEAPHNLDDALRQPPNWPARP